MTLKKLFRSNRRQFLTVISVIIVLYVFAGAGIFSYFHSSDVVSNRFAGKSGSVTIYEPLWNTKGEAMAKKCEPGMLIPKNPFGTNNGGKNIYVRLKMTVELEKYEGELQGTDTGDGEIGIPSDEKRLSAIINSIRLKDKTTPFLSLDTSGNIKDWKITSQSTSNGNFIPDKNNYSDGNTLVFYFYYTGGDPDNKMKLLKPGESTEELFGFLDIPVYKKDYLGVFDQKYSITLKAEAIDAGKGVMTAEEAMIKFDE